MATNLNLKRRGAPGSGCQVSTSDVMIGDKRKVWLWIGLAVGGLPIWVVLLALWAMFGRAPYFAAGLASYEGLPPTASDIIVFESRDIASIVAVNFKITEADFVAFAEALGLQVAPITSGQPILDAEALHRGDPDFDRVISNGLVGEERAPNGAGVTLVFDRELGRGFLVQSSR